MKKMGKLLLTFVLLLWFTADVRMDVQAGTGYSEGFGYTELEDGTVKITSYGGEGRTPVIPAMLNGKRVTVLGGNTFFSNHANITKVVISEGVLKIDSRAFMECEDLVEIVLPDSLTTIESEAFSGCSSLSEITIPAGVTSVGKEAFYNCTSLSSIEVSEYNSMYCSENGVLYNKDMSELLRCPAKYPKAAFHIPESVTVVKAGAFQACTNLETITIPEQTGQIESVNSTFTKCSSLSSIEVNEDDYDEEDGTHYLGGNWSYSSLDGVLYNNDFTELLWFPQNRPETAYDIPTGVTSIGAWAFQDCSHLITITVPETVTNISWCAFENCSSLVEMKLPETVEDIGMSLFENCSSLVTVTLPKRVTSMSGFQMFSGCTSLTEVVLPEEMEYIDTSMFSGCSSLTTVTIPEGVQEIGGSAFEGCSSLTDVTLPESVTFIGEWAFQDCTSLESINIPESVTMIWRYAFSGCTSLKTIYLPESVTDVEDGAFMNCTSLTKANIPEGISWIDGVFKGCSSLTDVTLPESIHYIGDSFCDCSSLETIHLPEGLISVSFEGCSSLKELTIPESITEIDYGAFRDCSSLTELVIPESVTRIREYAFKGCSGLTELIIPAGVEEIWDCAFEGCSGLTELTIPESVTYIGYGAFNGCSGLKELIIPKATAIRFAYYIGSDFSYVSFETGAPLNLYFCGACSFIAEKTISFTISDGSQVYIFEDNWDTYADVMAANANVHWVKWDGVLPSGEAIVEKPEEPSAPVQTDKGNTSETPDTSAQTGAPSVSGQSVSNAPVVGETVRDAETGAAYKVTEKGTVEYGKSTDTSSTSITVPKEVVLGGVTYKVTTIAANAFKDNKKLKSVTVGNNVKKIEASAFSGCTKLKSVTIGSGVTEIGAKAFSKCTALTKITIPAKVSKIGKQAFSNCKKLKTITIKSKKLTAKSVAAKAFKGVPASVTIKVPKAKRAAYKKLLRAKGLSAKVKIK